MGFWLIFVKHIRSAVYQSSVGTPGDGEPREPKYCSNINGCVGADAAAADPPDQSFPANSLELLNKYLILPPLPG
jgi:hypothetical protein